MGSGVLNGPFEKLMFELKLHSAKEFGNGLSSETCPKQTKIKGIIISVKEEVRSSVLGNE